MNVWRGCTGPPSHRGRQSIKGRVDDTNTHERPGSDVYLARRCARLDAGSPGRALVRRESAQYQGWGQSFRPELERGHRGRRPCGRLRGVSLGFADVSGCGDSARGRRSREGDVQPNCEAGRPPSQGPRPSLPGCGRQVEAVRAAEVRAPAGRHLLLRSDERHGEPDHGPGGRPGLQREELPGLGRSLRRRRLAVQQRRGSRSRVEAAEPGRSGPELGRNAHSRSERQEARHALPRHR